MGLEGNQELHGSGSCCTPPDRRRSTGAPPSSRAAPEDSCGESRSQHGVRVWEGGWRCAGLWG